jgi:hypothetical protein
VKQPCPRLPKVSEEMKAWSAAIAAEVATWPSVTTRPMFGLTALHRSGKLFGVLPRTRGMESANSLAFKLGPAGSRTLAQARRDPRIAFTDALRTRWLTFEVAQRRSGSTMPTKRPTEHSAYAPSPITEILAAFRTMR